MKRNALTLIVGIVLVGIFLLLLITFQVRYTEVAVVTTFGKATRPLTEPGLYFKLPWPIQQVYKFDKRVQTFEDKFSEDYTADGSPLNTMVYVGWRITDPKVFFPKFAGGSVSEAEKLLENLLRSEKAGVVGKHPVADFVNANEKNLKFDQIEEEIKTRIQGRFDASTYGLKIEFLGIKKLGLPESVSQKVFDRMTAERTKVAGQSESEGQALAQTIKSDADGKALAILANAEGQARQIRSEGEAAAAAVLPVFQKNPELAVFLLRQEALEQSLKERAILILDQRTPPFDLLVPANKPGAK